MIKKLKNKKLVLVVLIIVLGAVLLVYGAINITYAVSANAEPDYVITIENRDDQGDPVITCSGNLFGNELWYPGRQEVGIIRIVNNCNKNIRISNLGVITEILSWKPGFDNKTVMESFLSNMLITIESKKLLIIPYSILENKQLRELLYQEGDSQYDGITLDYSDEISIGKNEFINLKYTLVMDKEAGKELEKMKASVDFIIGLREH